MIDQFEVWLEEFKKLNGCLPPLTREISTEAINIVAKQKNGRIIAKVVKLYEGVQLKESFIALIQHLVSKQSYSSACQLGLYCKFIFT